MNDNNPFSNEGYALMGATFEVHKEIGGGLLEEIYQECLESELDMQNILFKSKQKLHVYYKGTQLKKTYIPDLIVSESIIVELKAVAALAPKHESQLINYMRITRQPVGYLINFGSIGQVEWKRFVLSEFSTTK